MSSSQLSRLSTQGSNPSSIMEAIRRLNQRVSALEYETVDRELEYNDLRSEVRRLEGRLKTMVSAFEEGNARLSSMKNRVAVAEAAIDDLRIRHDDLFVAFQRQSAELQRIQVLNSNMQAFMEQASRAEAYHNAGTSSYSQQTTHQGAASPQATKSSSASIGYGHSRSTAPMSLPTASASRHTYGRPADRRSRLLSRQRACPSLAEPPVIRGITIPHLPDSPSPPPVRDPNPRGPTA